MTVEKRGNKWCVLHGHPQKAGSETDRPAGSVIKCFNTAKEAYAMHYAIVKSEERRGDEFELYDVQPLDDNTTFSLLVQELIRENVKNGQNEDDAARNAYIDARKRLCGDSITRLTREQVYWYFEGGKPVPRVKDFSELQKAVERLHGRPLPLYARHGDAVDLSKVTGICYDIVADPTTKSVYGKTYPDYDRGTQNSIGFGCLEKKFSDGLEHQIDIDLDHVAISAELVGRGGETVAVIDAMPENKTREEPKVEAVPKKAEGDEIEAIRKQLADAKKAADEIIKQKDAEIELLKAKNAADMADIKALKERLDAIDKEREQKERSEVIAKILDPRRRLGDEQLKGLKNRIEGLDLKGVKGLLELADLTAPVRDSVDDEREHLFPVNGSRGTSGLYKEKPEPYKGAYN
ncbi:MAG: hypothetical protein Q6365_001195 [Candidatus Sigynarchaeota archaeon]